uniref:NADH dehydrogenase [ubiquinone] 1 alpha subcomplex subunit 13 n=1 Tax=Rhizophora mucronata TaxID=61149 RepID=A0A2P2J3F7_RHIMU
MTEAAIRKKPGMVSVKDMPVLQDGPPPGGFPPIRYARRIPNKGPSAMAIFLAAFGAFSYGMYQVGKGNKIRRWVFFFVGNVRNLALLMLLCRCFVWYLLGFGIWVLFFY